MGPIKEVLSLPADDLNIWGKVQTLSSNTLSPSSGGLEANRTGQLSFYRSAEDKS
jgi:hypothetical protein